MTLHLPGQWRKDSKE